MRKLAFSALLLLLLLYFSFVVYARYANNSYSLKVEIKDEFYTAPGYPEDESPRLLIKYKAIDVLLYKSGVSRSIAKIYLVQIKYANGTINTRQWSGAERGLFRKIELVEAGENYVRLTFYANASDVTRIRRIDTFLKITRVHMVEYAAGKYGTILFTNFCTFYLRIHNRPIYANYTHFRFQGSKIRRLIIAVDRNFNKYNAAVYVIEAVLLYYEAYLVYELAKESRGIGKKARIMLKKVLNKIPRKRKNSARGFLLG